MLRIALMLWHTTQCTFWVRILAHTIKATIQKKRGSIFNFQLILVDNSGMWWKTCLFFFFFFCPFSDLISRVLELFHRKKFLNALLDKTNPTHQLPTPSGHGRKSYSMVRPNKEFSFFSFFFHKNRSCSAVSGDFPWEKIFKCSPRQGKHSIKVSGHQLIPVKSYSWVRVFFFYTFSLFQNHEPLNNFCNFEFQSIRLFALDRACRGEHLKIFSSDFHFCKNT